MCNLTVPGKEQYKYLHAVLGVRLIPRSKVVMSSQHVYLFPTRVFACPSTSRGPHLALVIHPLLLHDLSEDGDSGVDRVGYDVDDGIWAVDGNSLSKGLDDACGILCVCGGGGGWGGVGGGTSENDCVFVWIGTQHLMRNPFIDW